MSSESFHVRRAVFRKPWREIRSGDSGRRDRQGGFTSYRRRAGFLLLHVRPRFESGTDLQRAMSGIQITERKCNLLCRAFRRARGPSLGETCSLSVRRTSSPLKIEKRTEFWERPSDDVDEIESAKLCLNSQFSSRMKQRAEAFDHSRNRRDRTGRKYEEQDYCDTLNRSPLDAELLQPSPPPQRQRNSTSNDSSQF